MSRIPRPAARRIDRMARRAHAFHRFAHHPLCSNYDSELITLGTARVCRGCAMVLGGIVFGALVGIFARVGEAGAFLGLSTALLLMAASLRSRIPKLLSRGGAAFLVGLALVQGAWASAAAFAVFFTCYRLYRRRGPNRSPCTICPERSDPSCSGMRPMIEAERAFQRAAAEILDSIAPTNSSPDRETANAGQRQPPSRSDRIPDRNNAIHPAKSPTACSDSRYCHFPS